MEKGIILYGGLGDVAALAALSHHFPELSSDSFSLITESQFVCFSEKYGSFKNVIGFSPATAQHTCEQIMRGNIAELCELHNSSYATNEHLSWLNALTVPCRIAEHRAKRLERSTIPVIIEEDRIISNDTHNVEYYARRLGFSNFHLDMDYLRLQPTAEDEHIPSQSADTIGFVINSRYSHKEWKAANWLALAEMISALHVRPVLLCANYEQEKTERLAQQMSAKLFVANDPAEYVRQVLTTKLVVSIDTGIKHIAGYLHHPLVALYGHGSPTIWGTRSSSEHVLKGSSDCHPCNNPFTCPYQEVLCLESITPDQVFSGVRTALERAS